MRHRTRVSRGRDRLGGVRAPPAAGGRLTGRLGLALAAAFAFAGCGSTAKHPPLPHLAHQLPGWLGLNYNSDAGVGSLDQFAFRGIVYDRDGSIEPNAGQLATRRSRFGRALAISIGAGMTPDIEVDSDAGPKGCTTNPSGRGWCLPVGSEGIEEYVRGFVRTAQSVLRLFPGKRLVFEPTDEPWDWAWPPGTVSGSRAADEYAHLLAQLLPAIARAAHPRIRLADVYVPATSALADGTEWIPDLYASEPCLAPGRGPCEPGAPATPIEGWNVHPYGVPDTPRQGIESVPLIRREMRSGAGNVIVSELGFCATNVIGAEDCMENTPAVDADEGETAALLAVTLREALPMHRAGWLRALIIWARAYPFQRSGTGWAMEDPNGILTPMGAALVRFGASTLH
ncbi:MAG TPA: hypothetical protein VMD48_11575 [Solirubrobacteraceae bacterium]|nr:hypothetical protein [Solirubrobacteraceae bacterium]